MTPTVTFLARDGSLEFSESAVAVFREESTLIEDLLDARSDEFEPIPVVGITCAALRHVVGALHKAHSLGFHDLLSAIRAANYLAMTHVLDRFIAAAVHMMSNARISRQQLYLLTELPDGPKADLVKALLADGGEYTLSAVGRMAAENCKVANDQLKLVTVELEVSRYSSLAQALKYPAAVGQEWAVHGLLRLAQVASDAFLYIVAQALLPVAARKHAGAADALLSLAQKADVRAHIAAIDSLGKAALVGNTHATDSLFYLRGLEIWQRSTVRCAVANAFGPIAGAGFGPAIEALEEMTKDSTMDVRCAASKALGVAGVGAGVARASHLLHKAFADERTESIDFAEASSWNLVVKAIASGILAVHADDASAIAWLQGSSVANCDLVLRATATSLGALAARGNQAATSTLENMARSADWKARSAAAEALGGVAVANHLWAALQLKALLLDSEWGVRNAAEQTLSPAMSSGHLWALELSSCCKDAAMRDAALKALVAKAVAGDWQAIRAISDASCSLDEDVLQAGSKALSNVAASLGARATLNCQQAFDICEGFLADKDDRVRNAGIKALVVAAGKGRVDAIVALQELKQEAGPNARAIAQGLSLGARALARAGMKNERARSVLEQLAAHSDMEVRRIADSALKPKSADVDQNGSAGDINGHDARYSAAPPMGGSMRSMRIGLLKPRTPPTITLEVNLAQFVCNLPCAMESFTAVDLRRFIKRLTKGSLLYYSKLRFIAESGGKFVDSSELPFSPKVVKVRGPDLMMSMLSSWLLQNAKFVNDHGAMQMGTRSHDTERKCPDEESWQSDTDDEYSWEDETDACSH